MQFVCYNNWDQLPDSANQLFMQCGQKSLFLSRIWFQNLIAHALKDGQSVLFACVLDGENILAMLPLMQSPQNGLQALSNHYTTHFSLLIDQQAQQELILTCLADGLNQMAFQSLRLDPIDGHDPVLLGLKSALEMRGVKSHPYFRFYNWVHQLAGQSFDDYMAQRPASLRNTIARKQRKLQREQGYNIKLYTDNAIDQALADYYQVYNASWKTNELFADFKPALVKSMAEQGWLRLAILYSQQKPVATQIWFVVHGKASIFRLAYDEAWQRYSPGSILTQYMMQYTIDTDKVTEIDFLTGKERYKQDWMSECRERCGLHFVKQAKPKSVFGYITEKWRHSCEGRNP